MNRHSQMGPELTVHSVQSDAPGTHLWSMSSPVEAAEGEDSGWANVSLGAPRDFTRWFSLVRIWSPWLAPRHGKGNFAPSEDSVLASFLRWDGLHLVLLAISGVDDLLTVFKPDGQGNVIISARNDRPEPNKAKVLAAVGATFETANAAVMYHARKLVRGDEYMSGEVKVEMKTAIEKHVKAEWMENCPDCLQDTHGESQFQRGWTRFEANEAGFPRGLKHTVTNIRDQHPGIEHIAVWHAIAGYWGGVSPHGEIAKNYKTVELKKDTKLVKTPTVTMVDDSDIDRMYDDFYRCVDAPFMCGPTLNHPNSPSLLHRFLLSCGIDSVKTDAQFALDLLSTAPTRQRLIPAYQDAWTLASLRHFSIKAISCMSQIPQILFHTQLPLNKPRQMVRNSDDFFPDIPSSHPWHIFVNAHNSLLTSHLNILPDWDMFQTSHPWSGFHAAGRCVSGGPIYITDEPGKHNIELINEMTARTTHDKPIILRPPVIGKTVGVYTAYEEERLLKVGTYTGNSDSGIPILALFNVSQRPLSELVHLNSFAGIKPDQTYVIRAHTTGEVTIPMHLDDRMPLLSLELDTKGYEILSAYPLNSIPSPTTTSTTKPTLLCPLGLLGKMTGAAALLRSTTRSTENNRIYLAITLKALGVLGIYISSLPEMNLDDDLLITMRGAVIPKHAVSVGKGAAEERVLSVDIETAWKEMGLKAGWGNEVTVEVFLSNKGEKGEE
ncbi:hypothetical protein ACLMJK_006198 [Lecanora helva]